MKDTPLHEMYRRLQRERGEIKPQKSTEERIIDAFKLALDNTTPERAGDPWDEKSKYEGIDWKDEWI